MTVRFRYAKPDANPPNKHQRKNLTNRRCWLERLTEMWPQAFDLKNPCPLAVGISDAITAELAETGAGGSGAVRYAIRSRLYT